MGEVRDASGQAMNTMGNDRALIRAAMINVVMSPGVAPRHICPTDTVCGVLGAVPYGIWAGGCHGSCTGCGNGAGFTCGAGLDACGGGAATGGASTPGVRGRPLACTEFHADWGFPAIVPGSGAGHC